jgi:hypothetical protein
MLNALDGSEEPVTYGQALAAMAERVPWGSEAARNAARDAILKEHDMYVEPPKPDDPHAAFVQEADAERERLAAELKTLREEKSQRDRETELEKLRKELADARGEGDGATAPAGRDYSHMLKADLIQEAETRGLVTDGTAEDLRERLAKDDRSANRK